MAFFKQVELPEVPFAEKEASSGANVDVCTSDEDKPHFKSPVQASTPHDKEALAGGVKHAPVLEPDDDELPVRSHEGELPIPSEESPELESTPPDKEALVGVVKHAPVLKPKRKFSVQESGERADQHLRLVSATHSYTKSKESDLDKHKTYKLEVQDNCNTVFNKFPKALGLIVLFACTVAAASRKLLPVPGVLKGVDKMIETFRYLGYAVLRLPTNDVSWRYEVAMKVVASIPFPSSYRRIFVYFTGHGGKDSIDTPDGCLKLKDIIKPFSPKKAQHIENFTKIFIFDTCSSLRDLSSILPHSVLLFPAHSGYPAFSKTGDCGLLTQHLAPALRTSSKSFGDIVIDVTNAITDEVKKDPELSKDIRSDPQPLLCQTLISPVTLVKERMEAMTPSINIQNVWPTSLSVVITLSPSSAQFDLQHVHLFYKCEETKQWTQAEHNDIVDMLGRTVKISNLVHGKHYIVKAVAVYPGGEEISSQDMPCVMPTEVEPVLNQDLKYCDVDSVEFEVCYPTKGDIVQPLEVVCQDKPIEWPENERVRISELEPGVQYTVTATACYPNGRTSESAPKSFEIPKNDVTPKIDRCDSKMPTRNSITVSVIAPPQADKYHLENLSAELRRDDEEECQSQTIQEVKFKTFHNLSPSTTYVAKAIATYNGNKVVSSDPIQITTSSVPYFKMMCSLLIALLMLSSLATVLTFLILFQPVHVPAVTKYGLQGDTIVVSDFKSFGLASVTITECPQKGDNSHTLKAALVKKSDLITDVVNYTGTINGSAPSRVSLLEDEYFLQESYMAFNICLSSQHNPSESSSSVLAFVFDSSADNQNFLFYKTDGIHSSVYHKALQVGSISKPICTWVNYSIASPEYYYLSLGEYSLGTLAYSADWYLHKNYLNFSDYESSEQYCSSVSGKQPCTFKLESLQRKEYILMAYICSSTSWYSPSTHACAKFKKNISLVVIVPVTLGTVTVSVFVFIVSFVLCKYVKKRLLHESYEYTRLHNVADDDN